MRNFELWGWGTLESTAVLAALSAAFVFLTIRRGSLTPSGAGAAVWLGWHVIFFAGFVWLIPLFFFFISGTVLGKLNPKHTEASDAKHGKGRDAWQVLCNGLPYAAAAALYPIAFSYSIFLMSISVAVAVADTWSSEIGIYCRGKTVDLLRLKKVPPGVSGGISWQGSFGGAAGAFFMALLCSYLMYDTLPLPVFAIHLFILSFVAGFSGMLLDSLLGSAFQIKYKNPQTGQLSDTASAENIYESGISWMTNDVVNLLSNLLMTAAALLFF